MEVSYTRAVTINLGKYNSTKLEASCTLGPDDLDPTSIEEDEDLVEVLMVRAMGVVGGALIPEVEALKPVAEDITTVEKLIKTL